MRALKNRATTTRRRFTKFEHNILDLKDNPTAPGHLKSTEISGGKNSLIGRVEESYEHSSIVIMHFELVEFVLNGIKILAKTTPDFNRRGRPRRGETRSFVASLLPYTTS